MACLRNYVTQSCSEMDVTLSAVCIHAKMSLSDFSFDFYFQFFLFSLRQKIKAAKLWHVLFLYA